MNVWINHVHAFPPPLTLLAVYQVSSDLLMQHGESVRMIPALPHPLPLLCWWLWSAQFRAAQSTTVAASSSLGPSLLFKPFQLSHTHAVHYSSRARFIFKGSAVSNNLYIILLKPSFTLNPASHLKASIRNAFALLLGSTPRLKLDWLATLWLVGGLWALPIRSRHSCPLPQARSEIWLDNCQVSYKSTGRRKTPHSQLSVKEFNRLLTRQLFFECNINTNIVWY